MNVIDVIVDLCLILRMMLGRVAYIVDENIIILGLIINLFLFYYF